VARSMALRAQREIDAALEAVRGIRAESRSARAAGDRRGGEEGALEEQVGGVERDAAVLAAHDAGHGQRLSSSAISSTSASG
jgi:hypothetical protein